MTITESYPDGAKVTLDRDEINRIFQALAQETRRLSRLPKQWDPNMTTYADCADLRDQFAQMLRDVSDEHGRPLNA